MTPLDPPAAPPGPVVWGVRFAPWTLARTVDEVDRLVQAGRPSYFVTANVHTLRLLHADPALRAAVDGAAFVVADGMPIVWASRLTGRPLPGRVAGSDLFPAVCERAARRGYRLFFLGGPPGVADEAAARLTARFPGLQVVGTESPPYRPLTPDEEAGLADRIRAARPHLLFVMFSQPKGEVWLRTHLAGLGVPVGGQFGASVDFAAGRVRRAPAWVQRAGLEWVYRISREPRRLVGRYAGDGLFLGRMVAADLARRGGRRPRPG